MAHTFNLCAWEAEEGESLYEFQNSKSSYTERPCLENQEKSLKGAFYEDKPAFFIFQDRKISSTLLHWSNRGQ